MSDSAPTPGSGAGKRFCPPRWLAVLLFLLALFYGISPVDLLPEALLGPIGLADDLGVVGLALMLVIRSFASSQSR